MPNNEAIHLIYHHCWGLFPIYLGSTFQVLYFHSILSTMIFSFTPHFIISCPITSIHALMAPFLLVPSNSNLLTLGVVFVLLWMCQNHLIDIFQLFVIKDTFRLLLVHSFLILYFIVKPQIHLIKPSITILYQTHMHICVCARACVIAQHSSLCGNLLSHDSQLANLHLVQLFPILLAIYKFPTKLY